VFVGSNQGGGGQNQIDCEIRLTTGDQTIVRAPAVDYNVDSEYCPIAERWKIKADHAFAATELYQLDGSGCITYVYAYDVANSCSM